MFVLFLPTYNFPGENKKRNTQEYTVNCDIVVVYVLLTASKYRLKTAIKTNINPHGTTIRNTTALDKGSVSSDDIETHNTTT